MDAEERAKSMFPVWPDWLEHTEEAEQFFMDFGLTCYRYGLEDAKDALKSAMATLQAIDNMKKH